MVRILLFLFLLPSILEAHQVPSNQYQIIVSGGKKGLKNAEGKIIIPPQYEDLGWSNGTDDFPVDNVIGYKKNSLWGLIALSNKKITPPEYSFLNKTDSPFIIAAKSGRLSSSNFFGVFNSKGEVVVPFRYSSIQKSGSYFIASERKGSDLKYGIISSKNEVVLPFNYKNISQISKKTVSLNLYNGLFQLFNMANNTIVHDSVTHIEPWSRGYYKLYKGLKSGLIDDEGQIIIPINYKDFRRNDRKIEVIAYSTWSVFTASNLLKHELIGNELKFFDDKIMLIADHQYQLLNYKYEVLIPAGFTSIQNVEGNKVLFSMNGKYGLYDIDKNKKVLKNYDSLRLVGEFIYSVRKKNSHQVWSIFDTFGIKRTKFEYQEIRDYANRLFAVKRRNHWGFMDRNGNEVIHCVYDAVSEFRDDNVVVQFHGEQGVINRESNWVVIPRKGSIEWLKDDLFLGRNRGVTTLEHTSGELIYFTDSKVEYKDELLWEYRPDSSIVKINLDGTKAENTLLSKLKIESRKYVNDEWVAVKIKGSYGFVDAKTNTLRISNRYQDVGHARGSLISVKILGKWGAIDKDENIIIQPNYEEELYFVKGISIIKHNHFYGLVNLKGEEVITLSQELVIKQPSGKYMTLENGKFGLVDTNGRVLINNKYDSLQDLGNGYVIIQKGEKFGVTTINGVNTIPQIYDKIIYNPQSDSYFALTKSKWELLTDEE